jgi:hypothetical protein
MKRAVAKIVVELLQTGKLRKVTRKDKHRELKEYVEVAVPGGSPAGKSSEEDE